MAIHVFLFLLVIFLLCLALLWRLCSPHLQPSNSTAGRKRIPLHRLLKPRTPLDCPACRLASTRSSGVRATSTPVRPWSEVKSRRGVPKRILTEGFACPNQQCMYFGITDAHMHALVGDGKHGSAQRIQTFRCQACRTTFSVRRNTPLYRLKTPSHQVAMVLAAMAEGLDASAAERVFGYRQATITTWLSRAGQHAQTLHEHVFCHLQLPYLQLDELRTRLCCHTHVLWLWLAIDPRTKILPVLHLGPRTQNAAHAVIHALRQVLVPGCLPLFTSDGLNVYFYALTAHFGQWLVERRRGRTVAGGGWSDLRSGEKMLLTTQARARQACDAPGDRGHSQGLLAGVRFRWAAEHRFHRAGEFDRSARNSGAGPSHLGNGTAVSPPACISTAVGKTLEPVIA
jgi:hypothetical protein